MSIGGRFSKSDPTQQCIQPAKLRRKVECSSRQRESGSQHCFYRLVGRSCFRTLVRYNLDSQLNIFGQYHIPEVVVVSYCEEKRFIEEGRLTKQQVLESRYTLDGYLSYIQIVCIWLSNTANIKNNIYSWRMNWM